MKLSDKNPEKMLIACAVVITATVLIMGHFDSPEYNVNIPSNSYNASYSVSETQTTTEAPHFIDGKINLNTATLEELMELEQIGEVRAQRIIEYREDIGGFVLIEELTNINGITPSVFEKNIDRITVG